MKKIAIYGAGGMGREAKWLIDDINKIAPEWEFIGYFDDNFELGKSLAQGLFLGGMSDLNNWADELNVIIAIGSPTTKRKIIEKIVNTKIKFPTVIHPNVIIGDKKTVSIGVGCIIAANVIITVDVKIGNHVLLNIGTIVCHDSVIEDYSGLMPSVNISGEVYIESEVYIGTGAKIINQITIGKQTVIGAGSVVATSIPSKCTAVGVPAKPIKFH